MKCNVLAIWWPQGSKGRNECFILVLGFPNKLVLQDTGVLCKIVDVEDITPLFYWSGGFDGSYNFAFYRWRLFF